MPYYTAANAFADDPDWINDIIDPEEPEENVEEGQSINQNPNWQNDEKRLGKGETGHVHALGNVTEGVMFPGRLVRPGTPKPGQIVRPGAYKQVLQIRQMAPGKNQTDRLNGVKYVKSRNARIKYEVGMGSTIIHRGPAHRRSTAVDTSSIRKHYEQKYKDRGADQVDSRTIGQFTSAAKSPDWFRKALIWVCALDAKAKDIRFYTHVCKLNRFHHSSFVSGNGVLGAGEWNIEKGMLKNISANSGHYRPDLSSFHAAVLKMAAALQTDTTVCMWDLQAKAWVDRPWLDFRDRPSDSGRFQVFADI